MDHKIGIVGAGRGMGRIITAAIMLGGFNNVVNLAVNHDALRTESAGVNRHEPHQGAKERARRLNRG